eukprot:6828189-Lingulodinium_polyedra.AAC.1
MGIARAAPKAEAAKVAESRRGARRGGATPQRKAAGGFRNRPVRCCPRRPLNPGKDTSRPQPE